MHLPSTLHWLVKVVQKAVNLLEAGASGYLSVTLSPSFSATATSGAASTSFGIFVLNAHNTLVPHSVGLSWKEALLARMQVIPLRDIHPFQAVRT